MRTLLLTLIFALGPLVAIGAPNPQPTPIPGTYVHDFAGVLTDSERGTLQGLATQMKTTYKTEIAIVTLQTTGGEDSFDYSLRMARGWGIGSKDEESRGLLILIVTGDRKISIRTSRHIEGELTDGFTGTVARTMGARFKAGQWGAGLVEGMNLIIAREKEKFEAPAAPAPASVSHDGVAVLITSLLLTAIGGVGAFIWWRRRQDRKQREARPDPFSSRPYTQPPPPHPTPGQPSMSAPLRSYPRRSSPPAQGISYRERATHRPRQDDYEQPTLRSTYQSSVDSSSVPDTPKRSADPDPSPVETYGGSEDIGGGGVDTTF